MARNFSVVKKVDKKIDDECFLSWQRNTSKIEADENEESKRQDNGSVDGVEDLLCWEQSNRQLENEEGDVWFRDLKAQLFSGERLWKRKVEEKVVEGGSQYFG